MLEAVGLRKSFAGRTVLDGVSLSVRRGEVACVIGPSGAGKSTLLHCLADLEVPDAGHVVIDGQRLGFREVGGRLRPLPVRTACRQRAAIGVVFQHMDLFPHLTALGNVTAGPRIVGKVPRREAVARGLALLDRFGLAHRAEAYPDGLSGGERQRVAIARALAMEPRLLLFDEPTSALDPERTLDVTRLLRTLADDGLTLLVVTHQLAFAQNLADHVIFMEAGTIVEEGTPHDIFSRPRRERTRGFLSRVA